MDSQWVDMSDPAEEPDDWQQAWDAMDAEEPPASPSIADWRPLLSCGYCGGVLGSCNQCALLGEAPPTAADWHGALAAPETWQAWEWDEALIRSLLPLVTYGPSRLLKGGA